MDGFRQGDLSHRLLSWVTIIAFAGHVVATEVSAPKFTVGPPANWIKPQFFDSQSTAGNLDAGSDVHWLLSERQINVSENETFSHLVRRVLNVSAVQDASKLAIDFNPDYQSLTLHWARIWRGPQHLERLDTNAVKIIRREQELKDDILNGEQSALLVMEDVRVGDIIDYAYSVKGANPVMGGHFFCVVPVQTDKPVERFLTRVLCPPQKRLYLKSHGCSFQPAQVRGTNSVEYIWDLRHAAGIQMQDSLPVWFDPEPWVQLGDFRTWAEVNRWALPLFQNIAPFSPGLRQKIEEWKRIPGREQQVLAALRFVQDEIRYFGVEIGVNGQKPCDPSVVFARRYGDCKDKSLLLVAILRALGVQASPVLVNGELCHTVEDWQPTGYAFDHCIAVVYLDGRTCWLDPTIQFQRGPLAAHYLPNYERGLVISPQTGGLSVIPQSTGLPQTTATEYFQLGRKLEPATLKVVTLAEGRDADSLRALFATTKRSDIEKTCTHFYADRYPGIRMADHLDFYDDEAQNVIQTTENYIIDNAWTRSETGGKYSFDFSAPGMATLLDVPADTGRTMPIGVPFPQHRIFRTEVTLPSAWPADAINRTVSDRAFFFQKNLRCSGNKVFMNCEYRSLADSVEPAQAADYIQHLNQASKALGYTLSW